MRKQYFFRQSPRGLLAWDVDRLVALTSDLPVRSVPLTEIRELEEHFFGEEEAATWRSFATHVRLVFEAELAYPIIRASDGAVMDGMHRVTKALVLGRAAIDAVQFATDPSPDYVGCRPSDLPYDDPSNER
jgi:hypothetical protein